MRYLLLFGLLLWGACTYARLPGLHNYVSRERYYDLDTSAFFEDTASAKVKDSMASLQNIAEAAHDAEFQLSIKLYAFKREYRKRLAGTDTTEYRLLQLASEAEDKGLNRVQADAMQLLGDIYAKNGQQSAAIEQYFSAYTIYKNLTAEEYPAKQYDIYQLGLIYYNHQDYESAVKYLLEALQLKQSTRSNMFAPIANTIGLSYRNMSRYDSAIVFFELVSDTAGRRGDLVWDAIAQGNIGIAYFHQRRYAEAIPLLKKDIDYGLANSNIRNAVNSMTVLAAIYRESGEYRESQQLLLSSLSYCHQKSFWSDYALAAQVYEGLYKLYGAQRNYHLSYLYADSALMAKDSVASRYNAMTQSQSSEKQNYIRRKVDAERSQSKAKTEQAKHFKQQQLLYKFIIGFLIVALVAAALVNHYRTHLASMATNLQDAPEVVIQKMSIVIISISTCIAAIVWASLYYYYYGLCFATFGPIIYFLVIGPTLLIYFFIKKQQLLVNVQLICIFTLPILMEWANGGVQSGVVINWSLLAPVGALMYKGIREAAFWMVLLVIAVICTIVFNSYFYINYHHISEIGQSMFYGMDLLGPAIIIYFSMQFYVRSVVRDGRLLQENNLLLSNTLGELKIEKQKSDDLLLNILPEAVADELKAKGTTTAKYFDNVTVIFTDFVDFTRAGERMTAQGLVDELDMCFKAFDEVMGKYGIEKIKTVGDAYLAVAGLPSADPKNAENAVRAAMEIMDFMSSRYAILGEKTFNMRIGIHSGSVVAGVVGIKKFAYDIWGDTVNTAARMEQNSEPGKINVSETTFDLARDVIRFTYRGEIDAKNKGRLKMYYVE